MVVPAGATNLVFSLAGGTGDADLYVKFGSAPTLTSYDCRPYVAGNTETCTIVNVQAGTYYVMVNAYAAYSGVTLKGSYSSSGNINYSGTITSQGGYVFTPNFTSGAGTATATLYVPTGTSWRFVADDATVNQSITEADGAGPLTVTFTAVAGHSYNFFVQATTDSGAWSIAG